MAYHADLWTDNAKCLGQPEAWDADRVPKPERTRFAYDACKGCPVLLDCAEAAIRDESVCVVRAGIMVPHSPLAARKALERVIANGGPKEPRRKVTQVDRIQIAQEAWADCRCECCDRRVRPRWSKISDFPGTVAGRSKVQCNTCILHEGKPSCPIRNPLAA